ncbi:hypothetical protein P618_201135 [Holospora obtusa F1]|uniref:Uncharacterized protein n=1 Tax=Holospora obtusa F1 TaxID=1399147 RepID=W6TDL5_HOLOB|nr:hypothetical protein P618_201135 [Holospora obtusa F1]
MSICFTLFTFLFIFFLIERDVGSLLTDLINILRIKDMISLNASGRFSYFCTSFSEILLFSKKTFTASTKFFSEFLKALYSLSLKYSGAYMRALVHSINFSFTLTKGSKVLFMKLFISFEASLILSFENHLMILETFSSADA